MANLRILNLIKKEYRVVRESWIPTNPEQSLSLREMRESKTGELIGLKLERGLV